MERKFFRETQRNDNYNSIEKVKIGIFGIGESVGTTFVATSLAYYFCEKGKSVAFVEIGNPRKRLSLLFDSVAMEKRFVNREFVDFYKLAEEKSTIRGRKNIEEGINWALITPDNCKKEIEPSIEQKERIINNISGEIVICDFDCREDWDNLPEDMDILIGVIEPLPSKMIGGAKLFKDIKRRQSQGAKVIWIVNKENKGVEKKEVNNYLKEKEPIHIPIFDEEAFYENEYNCKFHFTNKKIWEEMREYMDKIQEKMANITKVSH
ncbi:MAG: hypothetical protein RR313_06030 [Anaerovoracaceae bacterium]